MAKHFHEIRDPIAAEHWLRESRATVITAPRETE